MWNISGFSGFPDGQGIGTRHCPVGSAPLTPLFFQHQPDLLTDAPPAPAGTRKVRVAEPKAAPNGELGRSGGAKRATSR